MIASYQETGAKEDVNVSGTFLFLIRQLIKTGQQGKESGSGVIQVRATQSSKAAVQRVNHFPSFFQSAPTVWIGAIITSI